MFLYCLCDYSLFELSTNGMGKMCGIFNCKLFSPFLFEIQITLLKGSSLWKFFILVCCWDSNISLVKLFIYLYIYFYLFIFFQFQFSLFHHEKMLKQFHNNYFHASKSEEIEIT